jgi:Tol biopolymer transport system component
MPLSPGNRLGPYEILAPLGAGGMGEVYKAKDTRLDRTVAVKVLPQHLSSSAEVRQRFEREAKAIAALSHPHICALYDVGREGETEYLVMELLEGETLASRLTKGPLATDQTLKCGIEIADALDKAHRQGIVHRDLKPGNVMLTKSGVKLLDFGLAKAMAPSTQQSALTSLPTQAGGVPLTEKGTILGTFQYMAPEQLEGREADARSDIFAFGAVLYEMATGRKAFSGSSQASLISAIMKEDPAPISTVQPMTPPALDRVVRTCLAKDPDERWQNAGDLRSELKWIAEGSQAGVPAPVVARRRSRERVAWGIASAALVLAIASGAMLLRRLAAEPRAVRLSLEMPARAPFESFDHAAVSPDGRLIALIARSSAGRRSIWIRPLGSLQSTAIAGTEDALQLFWSPDSRSIGFFADGKLKRIEASGGPPHVLADAPNPSGGSWSRNGVILFCPNQYGPLFRVPAAGGAQPTPATKLASGEDSHIWPSFLPDGKHFVFLGDASITQNHSIRLGSLDSAESDKLVPGAVTSLAAAPPDWILFVRAGALVAQRLDVPAKKLVGETVPLGEQIASNDVQHGFEFSVSATGVLLYRSANPDSQLVWFDRTGKRRGTVGEPARYARLELSPDEKQVAFEKLDADGRHANLWLVDLARGSTSRLTSTISSDYAPVWSPDGSRLLFGSARTGLGDLFEIGAGGSGERPIFHDDHDKNPMDWSRDGRLALFLSVSSATREDVWIINLAEGKAAPLVATRFSEVDARFSPDGKWFAYCSDESGRPEIYVQSLADAANRHQVSVAGGVRPRWRGDGKELFFATVGALQSVEIRTDRGFEASQPKELFKGPPAVDYAATNDGQRFLAAVLVDDNPSQPPTVVLNWTSEVPNR